MSPVNKEIQTEGDSYEFVVQDLDEGKAPKLLIYKSVIV